MNKRMTEAMYASIPELVEAGITTAEIARDLVSRKKACECCAVIVASHCVSAAPGTRR